MILTRLTLQGIRCFANPFTIELAPAAINLITAPNGSGKSTLVEALRLAFLISHRSAGESIQSLVPWGASLDPQVTIEFQAQGRSWRASKRWLHSPAATLELHQNGSWSKHAEGPAAEERLRHFAGMPGGFDPGAASQHAWSTSVLWSLQGKLELDELPAPVIDSVRTSLHQQLDTPASLALSKLLDKRYKEFWTPTGRASVNSPASRLRTELDAARQRLDAAQSSLEQLDLLRDQLAALIDARAPLDASIDALARQSADAAAQLTQANQLHAARQSELSSRDVANAQASAAQSTLSQWRATQDTLDQHRARHATLLESAGPDPLAALAAATATLAAAEAELRDARAYRAALLERDSQRSLLHRLHQLLSNKRHTEDALRALNAPTAASWQQLTHLWNNLASTRRQLDSALVHLDLHAERPLDLTVTTGSPAGAHSLPAGASLRVSGSPAVELHIAGAGALRASGPPASAAELRAALDTLESRWTSATAPFAESSFDTLQQRRAQAAELEPALASLDAQLNALLAGRTLASLENALLAAESACAAHETAHPNWSAAPPDPAALEAALPLLRQQADAARQRTADARDAASLLDIIQSAEIQIADWTARHASLQALSASLDELLLQSRAHQLQIAELDARLAQFPPNLDATAQDLASQLAAAHTQLAANREESERLAGRIDALAATAPSRSLAEAAEAVDDLSRRLEALDLQANAVLRLHQTLSECQSTLMDSISAPIAASATAILSAITAAPLGNLRLSGKLHPDALSTPHKTVPLDVLSGGEQEQVHFATRLALARHLSASEPQLAVFDDVLIATDPARLARILAMLEEHRDRLQICILTCHPERFAALAGAHTIALPPHAGN